MHLTSQTHLRTAQKLNMSPYNLRHASMKMQTTPENASGWSSSRDLHHDLAHTWGDHRRTTGHPLHQVMERGPSSYLPSSKHHAATTQSTEIGVNASSHARDHNLDAAYETNSDSESDMLRTKTRKDSTNGSTHATDNMYHGSNYIQRNIPSSRTRESASKTPGFNDPDQPTNPERPHKPMRKRKLLISDHDAVTEFFESRLKDMQQLATKKIAKAWIKGICPRKQALFPYQDSSRRRDCEDPNVPEWWPRPEFCSFREPDHIKKEERTYLLIHILRLRPSVAQLKQWHNGVNDAMASSTKTPREDWAPFLKALAPASIFDDMPDIDGNDRKRDYRGKLLDSMYEVAFMEESYRTTGMHTNEYYHYEEEEKRMKSSAKRSLADSSDNATNDHEGDGDSRTWSSPSRTSKRVKQRRHHFGPRTIDRPLRIRDAGSIIHPLHGPDIPYENTRLDVNTEDFSIIPHSNSDHNHITRQDSPRGFKQEWSREASNADQHWHPPSTGAWAVQPSTMPGSPQWPKMSSSFDSASLPSFEVSEPDQTLHYDPCLTDFESMASSQRDHGYNTQSHQQIHPQHLQVNSAHIPVPRFEPTFSPMGTFSMPFELPMTPALQDMFSFTSSTTAPVQPAPILGLYDTSDNDGRHYHGHIPTKSLYKAPNIHQEPRMCGTQSSSSQQHPNTMAIHSGPHQGYVMNGFPEHDNSSQLMPHRRSS